MRQRSKIASIKLADPDAERVRLSHEQALKEFAASLATDYSIVTAVLPNNTGVRVPHKLGRLPRGFWTSPPRGAATAGVIQDYEASSPSGAPNDLSQTLSLRAISFGATITVTILVW